MVGCDCRPSCHGWVLSRRLMATLTTHQMRHSTCSVPSVYPPGPQLRLWVLRAPLIQVRHAWTGCMHGLWACMASMACMDYKPLPHESTYKKQAALLIQQTCRLSPQPTPPLHAEQLVCAWSECIAREQLRSMPAVSSKSDQLGCITVAGQQDLQFLQPSCICLHL